MLDRLFAPARRSVLGLLALGLAGSGLLGGCDNPSCVFVDACRGNTGGGGPGGIGSASAAFPTEGAFILSGPPRLVSVGPGPDFSDSLHPSSPVFLEFSESLDPASLDGAFRVIDLATLIAFPVAPPQLVGGGRVVVLLPSQAAPFEAGRRYQVIFTEDQEIRDLNGQALTDVTEEPLIDFAVLEPTQILEPAVIFAYPPDFSTNRSSSSEIVIGFDRPMEAGSFDADTFNVTVDGQQPVVDPAPSPLTIGVAGIGASQTQVWQWRPVDGSGRPVGLGGDVQVVVSLSAGVGRILAEDGSTLPATESMFQTLTANLPFAVNKVSGAGAPDGFGRADVFGGAPIVEVSLDEPAPSGYVVDAFSFGASASNPTLLRSVVSTVDVPAGATSLQLDANDLQLFDGAGQVQFADGDFECAVQLRLNSFPTGVRRFDADPLTPEVERPFFDTAPPVLFGLGASGANTASFVSGVRDFAAIGRASEPIEFAFVDAGADGTNGGSLSDPPPTAFASTVPGTDEALFIAAPVGVGAVDPLGNGVPYTITVYDRARNASTVTATGTFRQRGVVGPGGAPGGAIVSVRVYDERTLAPIADALVFSHGENGGAVTFVGSAQTDAAGSARVQGANVGDTLVTVDAPGYDLFTFHGIARDSLDVLLTPAGGLGFGTVSGAVTSDFPTGNFQGSTTVLAESRGSSLFRFDDVAACSVNATSTQYVCDYGPVSVLPSVVGASTFLATQDSLPQASFSPATYLRGFALRAPLAPVGPGGATLGVDLDAGDQLLLAPIGEQPVATPPQVLDSGGLVNLGMLDGDPVVSVEAVAAGVAGPLVVGRANPYAASATTWTVLGAFSGRAGPGGELTTRAAIDSDLFLRAALADTAGNQVVARPRLSAGVAQLEPIDVPRFLAPGPGGTTGGDAYNIVVEDTLPDSAGGDGLVRVVVASPSGRRWILWGLDTSDAAGDLLLSVPEIGAQGGSPLPGGSHTAEVRLWGGPFDRGEFLWTDIDRTHDAFARAAPVTFTQN